MADLERLFHATRTGNVEAILAEGLLGAADSPVHLSELDTSEFIYHLFGLEPGGFYEFHNSHADTVTLLEVDVRGLALDGPRTLDLEFSPDNDEHHMHFGTIPADRIAIFGGEMAPRYSEHLLTTLVYMIDTKTERRISADIAYGEALRRMRTYTDRTLNGMDLVYVKSGRCASWVL